MPIEDGRRLESIPHPELNTVTATLPVEIITLIIEHIEGDYSTLGTVALASRCLCDESHHRLYRSVFIWDDGRCQGPPVSAFANSPTLSKHLYSLTIHCDSPDHENWIFLKPGPVFDSMQNLKELDVAARIGHPDDILINCPFKLRAFCWNRSVAAPDYRNLINFLEQQDGLRYLAADQSYPSTDNLPHPHRLPPHICSNLECLEGNLGIIESVLPGRRVTTLIWNPLFGDPNRRPADVARELSLVTAYSHASQLNWVPPFIDLRHYFHNLQFLELVDVEPAVDLDTVSDVPSLIGLVFRRVFRANYPDFQLEALDIQKVFSRCPNLRFVDVERAVGIILYRQRRKFERWLWPIRQEHSSPTMQTAILEYSDFAEHVRDWTARVNQH